MYLESLTINNALQKIGHRNKARTITDTAYLEAMEDSDAAFKAILILESDATVFQWRSVSNIPM
jgi:hypothetical protein